MNQQIVAACNNILVYKNTKLINLPETSSIIHYSYNCLISLRLPKNPSLHITSLGISYLDDDSDQLYVYNDYCDDKNPPPMAKQELIDILHEVLELYNIQFYMV